MDRSQKNSEIEQTMTSHRTHYRLLVLLALLIAAAGVFNVPFSAQAVIPLPDPDRQVESCDAGSICISRVEPLNFQQAVGGTLTVYGSNFDRSYKVRLSGFGVLDTTWISTGVLTASVPATIIAPGQYRVQVIADTGEVGARGDYVVVTTPPPDNGGVTEPPPQPTQPVPTPGTPGVIVRGFQVAPNPVAAGGTVIVQIELLNQGTAAAQGIVVEISENDRFSPSGSASVPAGDLLPGQTRMVQLGAVVAQGAVDGTNTIPIRVSYRPPSGEVQTTNASATVTVNKTQEISLMTVTGYEITPALAAPGELVTITFTIMNAGTRPANSGLLRITGDNSVLVPAYRGDTLLIGNVFPGGVMSLDFPMVVNAAAKPGAQVQPVAISYMDGSENRTMNTSITINVDRSSTAEPLILLSEYDTGESELVPGMEFTLRALIENIGSADATNALLSFGSTITETNTVGGDDGSGTGTGTGSGSGSGGSSATVFAPIGTGETRYFESISAAQALEVEQRFLVSGTVNSGIYNLPIVVRYDGSDGTQKETTLPLNLLVVAQPRLQTVLQSPLPDSVEAGGMVLASWQVQNLDKKDARLGNAQVTVDNGEVVNGMDTFVGTLGADKRSSFEATIIPASEGPLNITLTLNYLDDMNRSQQVVYDYQVEVTAPFVPPMEEPGSGGEGAEGGGFEPPFEETPEPEPERDFVQDLIFGLLGLGQ
jgi:hypothetical protein